MPYTEKLKIKIVKDNFKTNRFIICSYKEQVQEEINRIMSDYPVAAYETKLEMFSLNKKERCYEAVVSHKNSAD